MNIMKGDQITLIQEKIQASGALVIPPNFDADVAAGKQPKLTVYVNNKKNNIEQSGFRRLVERQVESLVQRPPPAELNWINVHEETKSTAERDFNLNQDVRRFASSLDDWESL